MDRNYGATLNREEIEFVRFLYKRVFHIALGGLKVVKGAIKFNAILKYTINGKQKVSSNSNS